MKLVTFVLNEKENIGCLVDNDRVVDLRKGYFLFLSSQGESKEKTMAKVSQTIPQQMIEFLKHSEKTVPASEKAVKYVLENKEEEAILKTSAVTLLAPIPRPPTTMYMGPAYRQLSPGEELQMGFKPGSAVIGPEAPIILPKTAIDVQVENELGIVIGKQGKYIPEEEAHNYIAGYTIFNDVTDMGKYKKAVFQIGGEYLWSYGNAQKKLAAKGGDTFAPYGPCIALKEQIGDPTQHPSLDQIVRINGKEVFRINTGKMPQKVRQFVSFVSQFKTLQVGDVMGTGSGAQQSVNPGDMVELEIEKIGVLRNPVIAES